MSQLEYKAIYNCHYYFGQMIVQANNAENAKKIVAKKLKENHPYQWNSCSKVKANCNAKCKLKIII